MKTLILKYYSRISPIYKIILSFLILISTGSLLLLLPFSTKNGISFINAIFTATSAVCVTGLIVLDTAKDFTFFGQFVILILIQFGGLGIMTFSIGLLSIISGELSIKWQYTLMSFYSDLRNIPIKSVLKRVILYTVIFESTAAIFLFISFIQDMPFLEAIWFAIFHAVSAFCNAGFSTFTDSLIPYQTDTLVNITISLTVIAGGLGFLVLTELIKTKFTFTKRAFYKLTLHSKIVITSTVCLLSIGTLIFFLLEYSNTLAQYSISQKILISFFQSMSCRTAGFNTIDLGLLKENTLMTMVLLMIIGGSPGSIAGGIKTTTIWIIFAFVYSKIKKRSQVTLWNRAVDNTTIERSLLLLIFAFVIIFIGTFLIISFDSFHVEAPFLAALFEIASAFATVGLSTGITSSLTFIGKITTCIIMFTGRLGPLTIISALTYQKKKNTTLLPEVHVMIG